MDADDHSAVSHDSYAEVNVRRGGVVDVDMADDDAAGAARRATVGASASASVEDVQMVERREAIVDVNKLAVGGKQPFGFRSCANSHPVNYTGILVDRRALGTQAQYSRGCERPNSEMFLPCPEGDQLPDSWAHAIQIPDTEFRTATKTYCLFLPLSRLVAPRSSMNLVSTDVSDRAFMISWNFINKALCTGKIGTRSQGVANAHLFRDANDKVLPKVEVFGEPIVRSLGQKFRAYLERHNKRLASLYNRRTSVDHPLTAAEQRVLDENLPTMAASVDFRRELLAKDNLLGIRFWIVAYDKRFDLGRALQHRVWRNAVGCGDISAMSICQLQMGIEEAWRKDADKRLKERQDGRSGARGGDDAAGAGVDLNDEGPIESDQQQANSVNAQEQAREEDAVLNGGPNGVEPADSRDISGGGGGGGGAGGNADAQREAQKKAREERRAQRQREKQVSSLAYSLGLKSAIGDAKNLSQISQIYLQKIKALRMQEFPHLYAASSGRSGGSSGGPAAAGRRGVPMDRIGEEERRILVSYAREKHVVKVSITNVKQLVHIVYRQLLGIKTNEQSTAAGTPYGDFLKDQNKADDEALDLGNFNHPFHPSKWFNFSRINQAWGLEGVACSEQLDPDNYLKPTANPLARSVTLPRSGDQIKTDFELQFPAPSMVWRLSPEKGFKMKEMKRYLPFWAFFPLEEKLREVEQQANLEEALRAQGDARSQASLTAHISVEEEAWEKKERSHFNQMLKSQTWRDVLSYSRKYDSESGFASKADHSTDVLMQAMGHESAAQKATRSAHEVEICDRLTDVMTDSRQLRAMVDAACERMPSEERNLRRYYRDHQFDHAYKPQMHPQDAGVMGSTEKPQSDIHQLHVAYMSEGGPSNPSLFIPFTGFQNLTYRGSIIAEMHLALKHVAGVTNSIHVLWAMLMNGNPNAYRATRRIGLHMMKVGPPGIGKSWIDEIFKAIKVKGTAIEVVHSTTMSKLVEQATPDRNILEDEASSKVVGDTAKAGNAGDHTALTLHKAWLSSDYLSFTVFENIDGRRVQVRKRVLARGNHYTNANIQMVNKDTSIYDRYWIFVVVPSFNVTSAQLEVLSAEMNGNTKRQGSEWIKRMQVIDALQFRLAKMIDLDAASVCITPFVMHLLNGIPVIRRYGISNDPSLRRIPQGLEAATTATMSVGLLDTFMGTYAPTMKQSIAGIQGATVVERPWREDFMREAIYRMVCTEDICFYVCSQFYRQYIGDYNAWDLVQWMSRYLCGYSDSYFKDLFDREAWSEKKKLVTDPDTGVETWRKKMCQNFPFTDINLYVNENNNRKWTEVEDEDTGKTRSVPDIDKFVTDWLRTKEQWEFQGYEQRGRCNNTKASKDPNIAAFPLFVCWREPVDGGTAVEHQERIDDYILNGQRQNQARQGSVNQPAPKAARAGDAATAKSAQHAAAQAAGMHKAPTRQRIDPNMLLLPGGLQQVVAKAVRTLSHSMFKHAAVDEYSLLHLMQKRCVVVPELEEISDIRQPLTFKKSLNAKGESIIVTRTVPPMQYHTFPYDLVDPYTDRVIKAGNHLVINTMAVRCFDVRLGLFEFLTAIEHRFTMPIEAPIDINVPGFEGIMYTHKSKPSSAMLRKSMGSVMSSAVIRTLYMERTRRDFSSFPVDVVVNEKTNETEIEIKDVAEVSNALSAKDKTTEDLYAAMYEHPDVKDAVESFAADRDWSMAAPVLTTYGGVGAEDDNAVQTKRARVRHSEEQQNPAAVRDKVSSMDGAVGSGIMEVPYRIPAPRTHLPPSFRQEVAIASIEESVKARSQFYTRETATPN